MKKIALPIFLVMLTLLSCNTTEPIPVNENIKITGIDAAVIEAYLNIQIENPSPNKEVIIERDGEKVISFTASKTNTAISDTGLTENTAYKYKAKLQENGKVIGESSEVSITTMLPTSHNFTWETFTVGFVTSTLFDVTIIDENNIWVVGEIYTEDTHTYDSLGNWINPYNAVHWDGTKWELKRIRYYGNCSAVEYPPLKAIWAFSADNIIITNGGSIGWFDGSNVYLDCGVNPLLNGTINKIWGISSEDLYIVGDNGNIAHYNGADWEKIESGTDVRLTDVYGDETGENIFISGYNDFKPTVLLMHKNKKTEKIIESTNLFTNRPGFISGIIRSVWLNRNRLFTLTTYDLYNSGINTNGEAKGIWKGNPYDWGVNKVRGNDINDIITCGVFGRVWHYNGVNWKIYTELVSQTDDLYKIEIKGNICVAIGERYINGIERKGIIHIGRR